MVVPVVFFANKVNRHEQPGEGTVRGVVYQNKISYTRPKTFQNNVSQDSTIKTIDTCLVQKYEKTGSVPHKKVTRHPRVLD
jgi:hypothetical protein